MEKNLDQVSTFGVKALTLKKAVFKQITHVNPMKGYPRPTTEDAAFGSLMGWVNGDDGKLAGFITKMPNNTLAYIYYDHLVEAIMYFIRQDDPNRAFKQVLEEAKANVDKHQKRLLQVFVA